MPARPIALSVLDLSPVAAGSSGAISLRNSLDLARLADRLAMLTRDLVVYGTLLRDQFLRDVAAKTPESFAVRFG
jgi:hypothetical protein